MTEKSKDTARLEIGQSAYLILRDRDFIEKWKCLADAVNVYSVLQEHAFVSIWYDYYQNEYDPVLIFRQTESHRLTAIMCLAWHRVKKILTHAGHDNSEYFGWIALPENEPEFLRDAFLLLRDKFGLTRWPWRWLAPGIDPGVFSKLRPLGIYTQLERRESPVWDLLDPGKLQKLRTDSSLKSKWKRLQKKGVSEFRVLTEENETAAALREISEQCDFRREVANNVRPFEDNPQKIDFNAALQRYPGIIHVSILKLNNRIIAFHLGICDSERVCLGITSFDPAEAKNSPGALLMMKLGEELTQSGYKCFDLTPGTDEYKKRFANGSTEVYRPVFHFSKIAALKGGIYFQVRLLLKKFLSFFGVEQDRISNFILEIKEFKNSYRNRSPIQWIKRGFGLFFTCRSVSIFQWKEQVPHIVLQTKYHENQCEDLMKYNRKEPWTCRRKLLQRAYASFNQNEKLYSQISEGKLSWFVWQNGKISSVKSWDYPVPVELERESIVFYNFYRAPEISLEEMNLCLQNILNKSYHMDGNNPYIVISLDQQWSRDLVRLMDLKFIRKETCLEFFSLIRIVLKNQVLNQSL